METRDSEFLIIGAGLIGSSLAWHLARLGARNVRVLDFDLEGTLSSSELNAGGVRATWIEPINIEMSRITIDYLASVSQEVGYRACGYLWLHPEERLPRALQARETQLKQGWPVEAWDTAELRRKVPFIDKTDGIAGALFAPRDGLVNPNLLKIHFRAQARALGAVFDDRVLCRQVEHSPAAAKPYQIRAQVFPAVLSQEYKAEVLASDLARVSASGEVAYSAKIVINCAGAWAGQVAKMLGYSSPVHAARRQVTIFDCRDVDLTPYGMVVDTSGVYFHPEATYGLSGFADPREPQGINYHYDGETFFNDHIWPALYERSSAFERLKHLTGWAGQYEVSPDECAIIGTVENGEAGRRGGIFEAHSFSGHGVMHSHAAGMALAEQILNGRSETVDLAPLAGSRFERGRPLGENLII